MKIKKIVGFCILILLTIVSCKTQKHKFEFLNPTDGRFITKGEAINIQLVFPSENIDSVVYSLDGVVIERKTDTSSFVLHTVDVKYGSRSLTAKMYGDNKEKIAYSNIMIVPPAPQQVRYEVINTYPHAADAFTQGLEYHNGYLYESTGIRGESTLRKVNLETGVVEKKIDLNPDYFGEGLTIQGNKIVQLTWMSNTGLVYDKETFELIKTFNYQNSKEGWGVCYDGEKLIKSDGTDKLYFLDPETYQEMSSISVFDDNGVVDDLNELEYINGKVWANLYTKDIIVIIDPQTGVVEGKLNFVGQYTENREPQDNEMNGIAYDKKGNRIFLTGKKWSKLFEIKLID